MPTTANGLPYPSSSDPIAEGAAAIRALAEALDTEEWSTWTTGVTEGFDVYTKTFGPALWVLIQGTNVTIPNGTNTTIATGLPRAFTGAWSACSMNNYPALVTVSGSGALTLRNQTGATRTNCYGLFLYPLGGGPS